MSQTKTKTSARTERDTMGVVKVPADALWGASTQRARQNFPVSGLVLPRSFIRALALVKLAACRVNREDGLISARQATGIKRACAEMADGKLDSHFVVDVFQTGSGTSTNMNANEVIANRAAEFMGGKRGDRGLVHPNDTVNLGQSSNDVIPTSMHVAAACGLAYDLLPALKYLEGVLYERARAFAGVLKTGRTHLQDATPITLGQEFSGYAAQVGQASEALVQAQTRLRRLALGGTACGTGINTRADFAARAIGYLSSSTGVTFVETSNHFQAQSSLDDVVAASSALKQLAVVLMKVANDVRWMSSGPRAGFAELVLPAVQPGSSIMPGKVNPVIAESVCQVAAQVIGNDLTICVAGQSGNFELNVMMPVAAYNLLQSIDILSRVCRLFGERCLTGLEAGAKGPASVETGLALATALVPRLGYDRSAEIAKEAARTGESVREVARRVSGLSEQELTVILDAERMTRPDEPVRKVRRRKSSS